MNLLLIFMEEGWAGLDVLTEEILESSSGYRKIPTGSRKKEWRSVNGDLWGAPRDKDYSGDDMLQNREVSNSLVLPECALDFVR